MQYPDATNTPQVLRLLQAVVDVAIRFPDEPNVGALLEQFRETEFATEVSRLITHRDSELDDGISDEEAESELRQLRAQIEDGGLFPRAQTVSLPAQMQGVGILALGARRQFAAEPAAPTAPPIPAKSRGFVRPARAAASTITAAVSVASQEHLEHPTEPSEHDDDIAFDFESPRAARAASDQDAPF